MTCFIRAINPCFIWIVYIKVVPLSAAVRKHQVEAVFEAEKLGHARAVIQGGRERAATARGEHRIVSKRHSIKTPKRIHLWSPAQFVASISVDCHARTFILPTVFHLNRETETSARYLGFITGQIRGNWFTVKARMHRIIYRKQDNKLVYVSHHQISFFLFFHASLSSLLDRNRNLRVHGWQISLW